MKKYIDYKQTMWSRITVPNDIDLNILIEEAKLKGYDGIFNYLEDNEINYEDNEILETSEFIDPSENDGGSTIEIYENYEKIWDNS